MTTIAVAPALADYFESVYTEAGGDSNRIPWPSRRASPALVNWLNAMAPSLVRCGARVAVAGCGLGHDAREVIRRGYEVLAFDFSAAAVRWARSLDPDHVNCYVQADLFKAPARWMRRFDLVVDSNNLNYFAPGAQHEALAALSKLLAPHGLLLVVCAGARDADADAEEGPPWPLSEQQLREAAAMSGLAAQGPISCFADDENQTRLRAVFRRA